jgi:hypothetical protein
MWFFGSRSRTSPSRFGFGAETDFQPALSEFAEAPSGCQRRFEGTREIRVILYAKDDPFCAAALADELSVEDTLAIEHEVIPLDGADVF